MSWNETELQRRMYPEDAEERHFLETLDAGARVELFTGSQALEIQGEKLTPDLTKGYLEFYLAYGFPVVSAYNKSLHADTVANSFQSMRHQGMNFNHSVKSYEEPGTPERDRTQDRFIGSVLHAEHPAKPHGGFKIPVKQGENGPEFEWEKVPGMRCVATLFKRAHLVDKFLGEHTSGRHTWTVSLEASYFVGESGVIVLDALGRKAGKKLPKTILEHCAGFTPDDFQRAECLYVPVTEAPDDMLECWDRKKRQFTKEYHGRQLVLAMNGLNGKVHFSGVGVVKYGAEPTAVMGQVLASDEGLAALEDGLGRVDAVLGRLAQTLGVSGL